MANIYYMTGVTNWTKVLGDPVPNYNRDGNEWTFDFTPDNDGMALLREIGLDKRLKNKDDVRGEFIQFRQREETRDGKKNRPITVVDAKNRPWNPKTKIGNGSTVEVKFNVKDYGPGKNVGVYPMAIRVLNLIPYERQEFAELPEDNEFVQKADDFNAPDFNQDFGLEEADDEVPDFEQEQD